MAVTSQLLFEKLPQRRGVRLHLGCNKDVREGFINIDMLDAENPHYLQWDLSKGLPAEIGEVEYVYSSHFIEHLTNEQVSRLLEACYERMVPGGILRAALPYFEQLFRDYCNRNAAPYQSDIKGITPNGLFIELVEYGVYQHGEHVSLWDTEKAEVYLKRAGFKNVRFTGYKDGVDVDTESRRRCSFYVEAEK